MFELSVPENSEFVNKLKGSRSLITTVLEDWKKQIIKAIQSGNFSPVGNSKESDLNAIWLDAELGKEPVDRQMGEIKSFVDKNELINSIKIEVLSETRGRITVAEKYAKEFEKGGVIRIPKKNPNFNENIDKYLKKNEKKMEPEKVNKVKSLKSLSQLSVTLPQNPFTDYNQSRVTNIVKEYLER